MSSLTPENNRDDSVAAQGHPDAGSELRKRFSRAILEWLEEQGYNDEDADAILRAIFDKVNRDAE